MPLDRPPVPVVASAVPAVSAAAGAPQESPQGGTDLLTRPDTPWVTIVWNDPVNLMSYVTYVFMSYFGYSDEVARKLMTDVHTQGKAVVSNGTMEEMERDTEAMHGFGLWATFTQDQG